MSNDESFPDLAEGKKQAVRCCNLLVTLASIKSSIGRIDPQARRWDAHTLLAAVKSLEGTIPVAATLIDVVAEEVAEARSRITPGGVAKACGLKASSYHLLSVDLAREVLARVRGAAEEQGAKFHEVRRIADGQMMVVHHATDEELGKLVQLDALADAVSVDAREVERLAQLVHEENRIVCRLRTTRMKPGTNEGQTAPKDPEQEESTSDAVPCRCGWDPRTCARNKWIYEECRKAKAYSSIINRLKAKPKTWERIGTPNGIKYAAKAYADRHQLAAPPERQRGRPHRWKSQ